MLARDRPDDPDPDSPRDLDPHPKVAAQAAALEAIFRASYDGLFAAAFRFLRSRPLAEEVVQDVFATMWERRDRWGEGELVDLRRYLFGAVQNRAISLLRRERVAATWREGAKQGRRDAGVGQFTAAAATPEERSELVERLERAIDELSPRAREALLLRIHRQLQNTEIAQVMGVSVKAVEASLARRGRPVRRGVRSRGGGELCHQYGGGPAPAGPRAG